MRDLAWSHWTELGVAGAVRNHEDVLLDPEALVLYTSALRDLDPRLRDESLDWCVRFGRALSISRLKNLLASGLGDPSSFDDYATVVNSASKLRWPARKKPNKETAKKRAMSGKSREPDLTRPALTRLRLRAIFGVGTRADILTELLYFHRQSASELAAIGYSKRQVQTTVDDLTRAGLLTRTAQRNSFRFELSKPQEVQTLFGRHTTYYGDWVACFRVLLRLRGLIDEAQEQSERLRALAIRRAFVESSLVSDLERLRWGVPVTTPPESLWQRTLDWSLEHAKQAAEGPPDRRNTSFLALF